MKRLPWALLAALLALSACNQAVPGRVLTLQQFTVQVPGVEFPTHDTLQLTAWGLYNDGSKIDVSDLTDWSSDDETVARIGPAGFAQLDGVGQAHFAARFQGRRVPISVHVSAAELQSLTVSSVETGAVARGDARSFTAIAAYADGTTLDVTDRATWVADGVTLASTGIPGLVRAHAEGPGLVRAIWYSQQTSVAVKVVGPRFLGLELNGPPVAVHPGDSRQLVVSAKYSDGSARDVSAESAWTSSDANIADLSTNGVILARGEGRANITARWNGASVSIQFVVIAHQVVRLILDSGGVQLPKGRSALVDLYAQLEDETRFVASEAADWTSSQPAVAEVSNAGGSRGVVTARGLGTATITAHYAGLEASWDVEVTAPVLTSLDASLTGGRLLVGQSANLVVVGTYSDGSTLNLSAVVSVTHGPGLVSTFLNDRIQVTGTLLGLTPVEFAVSGGRTQVTFEVTETGITTMELREIPQGISSGVGAGYRGRHGFRAFATYADGVAADVTELGSWWLEDAMKATLSDSPGSRGTYLLTLGGNTAVQFAIAGETATLEWSFPATP